MCSEFVPQTVCPEVKAGIRSGVRSLGHGIFAVNSRAFRLRRLSQDVGLSFALSEGIV